MADKRRYEGRHRALAELATRQHGVVSAFQLRELGYSRDRISGDATQGRLVRLHRGVYAVGHCDLSWSGRCLAAVLASAPALASHASAGRLWGLLAFDPQTFDLTTVSGRRRTPAARIHRAYLMPEDEAEVTGVPVTSVARTVLDLADALRRDRLERLLERAEELNLLDLVEINELMSRTTRHKGRRALRAALAAHGHGTSFTRSGLERRFLRMVMATGLSRPSMNFNVAGYELDAYWADERLGVELDVFETHGSRAAFERDRVRDEDLALAGTLVIRVTGARLDREPEEVMARVSTLLARRRRELGG